MTLKFNKVLAVVDKAYVSVQISSSYIAVHKLSCWRTYNQTKLGWKQYATVFGKSSLPRTLMMNFRGQNWPVSWQSNDVLTSGFRLLISIVVATDATSSLWPQNDFTLA